jgi:mannose-6-phosphate isomerase-like protein (cupin superfamily)
MPVDVTATLVDEGAVVARCDPGDSATVRVTLDAAVGCRSIEQRVMRFGPGRSTPRRAPCEEVWYVVAGRGTLRPGPESGPGEAGHALGPGTGVLLAPGSTWAVDNPEDNPEREEILVVSVRVPGVRGGGAAPGGAVAIVHLADQPAIPTGDREFRILVDPSVGCQGITQFVGWIPPGRAPAHSHTYEEVVYVLEGQGLLHVDGSRRAIGAGSCIHLPPPLPHCLENTGSTPMRVLGVFHPAGSPASKAEVPGVPGVPGIPGTPGR